jgi:hypothetical protein
LPKNETKSIVINGIIELNDPPGHRLHSFHFRTDTLFIKPDVKDYEFNIFGNLNGLSRIEFYRAKVPNNSFAPFENNRGKIINIIIETVYQIDHNGFIMPLNFKQSNTYSNEIKCEFNGIK